MGNRLVIKMLIASAICYFPFQIYSQSDGSEVRVFARTKSGELSAEINKASPFCSQKMAFTVRGQEDFYFKEGEVDDEGRQGRFLLNKLLGGVRVGLERECPKVQSITFNGFVDDVFVFRGQAEKMGGQGEWILIETPVDFVEPPPPPQNLSAANTNKARVESVRECDELASHPDDPKKPKGIKGVSDEEIKAGEASEKCSEAFEIEPDNPRIMYQLARSLIAFGKAAKGLEILTEAAEEGYAVAIATLGDVALYGILDDNPDPETAKALYKRAAKGGFKPAAKLADSIQADPKEDSSQSLDSTPVFLRKEMADVLLKGKPVRGSGDEVGLLLMYMGRFVSGIEFQCKGAVPDIDTRNARDVFISKVGFLGALGFGEANNLGRLEPLKQDGMDDGYALAVSRGCKSKEVKAAIATYVETYRF